MEIDNNKPEEDIREPADSSQLSDEDDTSKGRSVSRVADISPADRTQRVSNEASALNNALQTRGKTNDNNRSNGSQQATFNIQLPYDVDQATDQDLWDGAFQPVSLHGSLEHLPSDIKNIKVSLSHITKYILNKSVERGKVNDLDDLKGVGKVAWELISAFYDSGWDALSVDNNMSFRSKVASKFTPKINNIPKNKGSNDNKNPASVSRLPKEVKDITKFFKKIENSKGKENMKKSYAQASSSGNIAREVLKIKEAFPNLQGKKIENIQKIINGGNKPKPRLNMTTKGPSHK